MPLYYDNTFFEISLAVRTFDPPMDWSDYDTVNVWIYGDQNNTGGDFFIQVNDIRAYQNVDLSEAAWKEVKFDLNSLDADKEMVTSLGIGVYGNYINGIIYIGDIELDLTISTE